jgi:hypothetical protein
MPAIVLVGAYASVTAGIAAGGLLGGMMIAGGVMTGLGTVTKNPKLTKIGAILSLAGGVGSAISKAGAAGAAASGAEAASSGAAASSSAAASPVIDATASTATQVGAGAAATPVTTAAIDGGMSLAPAASQTQPFSINSAIGAQTTAPQMSLATSTPALNASSIAQEAALAAKSSTMGQSTATFGDAMKTLGDGARGAWKFIKDKENAELIKAGSGLVGGAMKSYNEQDMMREKLRQEEEGRRRFNQSIINQPIYRRA